VELYQIRYFLALCDTLNFMRAAERCHVSQPSLTRAVQKLERELGGLLIRRERRRTHLTELGQLVRPVLGEVLAHGERAKAVAARHRHGAKNTLKLGVLTSIGPLRFASLLAEFSRQNPGIELKLVDAALPALFELLFGGALDAAVVAYVERTDKALRYVQLYMEQLVCAMPPGHPFERMEAVRLRDLKGQEFLVRSNCENGETLVDSCRQQGFELRVTYRSDREDWVQAMVAAGCGITIMPEFTPISPGLVLRPLVDPALYRELSLVTVAGRPHGEAVTWLLRALRAHKWDGDDAPPPRARKLSHAIQILSMPTGNGSRAPH
jgi:DNA-binding transcriptional LysR family regulator